jgi:hypothetical protein
MCYIEHSLAYPKAWIWRGFYQDILSVVSHANTMLRFCKGKRKIENESQFYFHSEVILAALMKVTDTKRKPSFQPRWL